MTTPLLGMTCHNSLGLATINLQTKFAVSNYTYYEDAKSGANVQIGVAWGA